jgi:hypothetical protein
MSGSVRIRHRRDATEALRVLTGDLQRGYWWTSLDYESADLVGAEPEEVWEWLSDGATEIGHEEIEICQDGRFEHRLLLWPQGEFRVRFERVAVDERPASPADRR